MPKQKHTSWRCMLCGGHLVGLAVAIDSASGDASEADRFFCGPCYQRTLRACERPAAATRP